jgi:hypothetical protein
MDIGLHPILMNIALSGLQGLIIHNFIKCLNY